MFFSPTPDVYRRSMAPRRDCRRVHGSRTTRAAATPRATHSTLNAPVLAPQPAQISALIAAQAPAGANVGVVLLFDARSVSVAIPSSPPIVLADLAWTNRRLRRAFDRSARLSARRSGSASPPRRRTARAGS